MARKKRATRDHRFSRSAIAARKRQRMKLSNEQAYDPEQYYPVIEEELRRFEHILARERKELGGRRSVSSGNRIELGISAIIRGVDDNDPALALAGAREAYGGVESWLRRTLGKADHREAQNRVDAVRARLEPIRRRLSESQAAKGARGGKAPRRKVVTLHKKIRELALGAYRGQVDKELVDSLQSDLQSVPRRNIVRALQHDNLSDLRLWKTTKPRLSGHTNPTRRRRSDH